MLQIRDHVGALFFLAQAGEGHLGPGHVFARVLEIGLERLGGPDEALLALRDHRVGIVEVLGGAGGAADHAVQSGSDAVLGVLADHVAGLALAEDLFAGLGIGAVAIGFAFQDIFENFMAGVLIMLREKMRIGDIIECEGITGKVEHITLRETHVRKLSGELTVVPNSILFKNPVEIFTDVDQRRHEVVVGVSYDTQLDHAADVIRRAVEDVEDVLASKGIDIFAQEFNSSSVDFLVRWWAGSTPRNGWESKDKVVRAIKAALDDAGIEIPFPYVTHTFKETVPVSQLGDTSRKTP